MLSLRREGNHSHVRLLEGGNLTKRHLIIQVEASRAPALRDILKTVGKVRQTYRNADMLSKHHQSTLTAHDSDGVDWETVVLRRTNNRKTGVVMSEDRTFEGELLKKCLQFLQLGQLSPQCCGELLRRA